MQQRKEGNTKRCIISKEEKLRCTILFSQRTYSKNSDFVQNVCRECVAPILKVSDSSCCGFWSKPLHLISIGLGLNWVSYFSLIDFDLLCHECKWVFLIFWYLFFQVRKYFFSRFSLTCINVHRVMFEPHQHHWLSWIGTLVSQFNITEFGLAFLSGACCSNNMPPKFKTKIFFEQI